MGKTLIQQKKKATKATPTSLQETIVTARHGGNLAAHKEPHIAHQEVQRTPVTTAVPSSQALQKTTQRPLTRILVKCDCGFGNQLFIRGEGVGLLTWEKGIQLRNIQSDQWVWETASIFNKAQFKLLINDTHYETGDNHWLTCGSQVEMIPKF